MKPKPLVLIIDDVVDNVEVLGGTLFHMCTVQFATSGQEGIDLVRGMLPDLILLDVMMPEMDGYEVCAALKGNAATRDVPIIFVTAKNDAESETKALAAGAVDFIHKPIVPDVVRARVDMQLRLRAREVELRRMNAELELRVRQGIADSEALREMATTDFLTGLANRRSFIARLKNELDRFHRVPGNPMALLMLDLDHFKQVNDGYGHATGDSMLQHFAAIVRNELRSIDMAARIGGEEFGIFLPGADVGAARTLAERLRSRTATSALSRDGQRIPFTVSIGVTTFQPSDGSPEQALGRADQALYRSKNMGRNRVELEC